MGRAFVAAMAALAALGACSGTSGSTTSTLPPATTISPTSTTTLPVSTTSAPAASSLPPVSGPTTLPASDGPSGSGCTPGDAATLPEGEWFGFVTATSANSLEFDLACWFSGDAAVEAAAEDGEESPPPNDYYIRNENPQVRSLPVSSGAPVTWYPGDPTSETEGSFEEWAAVVAARGFLFGVWLDVIDGEVQQIREQWVP